MKPLQNILVYTISDLFKIKSFLGPDFDNNSDINVSVVVLKKIVIKCPLYSYNKDQYKFLQLWVGN